MINVDDELLHIDNEYSETEIFLKYGVVSLMFYEPTPYTKLIVAINNERDKYNGLQERERFIPLYRKVYLAQRRKLKNILDKVKNRTIVIEPEPTPYEMENYPKNTWKYKYDISNRENVYQYAETRLKKAIFDTNQELYILRKYPEVYYNRKSGYIGGEFNYRYELHKPEPKGKIISNGIKLLAPMISIANGIPTLADHIQKFIDMVTPYIH